MEKTLGRETVFLRDEEYGRIWMLLRMFMESEKPLTVTVVAWGGPGTGKTTFARRLMENAAYAWKNLEQVYLAPVSTGCSGLLDTLQHASGLRGYSGPEILNLLLGDGFRFLIVIDNAETFLHAEGRISAVLRMGEAFPEESFFILMIFRSEKVPIEVAMVPPPVYPIYFRPYGFEEIHSILREYLRGRGDCSADEEALETISRIASFSGNARLALSILEASLNASKEKHVDEACVSKVLRELASDPLTLMNVNLHDAHEKMILKIVSRHPQNIRLKHLFKEYERMAEEKGVKPLGYTQLWKKIRMLENRMLLDFKVINFNGGRTGVVGGKDLD